VIKKCDWCWQSFSTKVLVTTDGVSKYRYSSNRSVCFVCKQFRSRSIHRVSKGVAQRQCGRCRRWKIPDEFTKRKVSGKQANCKDCARMKNVTRGRIFMSKARRMKNNMCGVCNTTTTHLRFFKEPGKPSISSLKSRAFESLVLQDYIDKSLLLCRPCETLCKTHGRQILLSYKKTLLALT
jgi:hypothetical protein